MGQEWGKCMVQKQKWGKCMGQVHGADMRQAWSKDEARMRLAGKMTNRDSVGLRGQVWALAPVGT